MWHCFNASGVAKHLPFIMMPSITSMSSLNDQYALMSWCTCSLLSGQPAMINPISCCKCSSCVVACCICWTHMYSGTFIDACFASTLMSMSCIAASLFSLWFRLDSQSAIKIFSPGLYSILTLYWCILRRMCWIHCNKVATSSLTFATRGLWSVIILISLAKQ